ncbi:MAG: exodeoxyribonuclease VII small subunit [Bacteroidales bacterium]|nr:exodeoxyribonuclease VII small subunit [Bacteroidales bacterium]
MTEEFNYDAAMAELERIEAEVRNPSTPLPEIDVLIRRSSELVDSCRKYLRSQREILDSYENL